MPVATIENKSVQIDDDLTDLSWLIQMNNTKQQQQQQRYSTSNEYNNHENKNKKIERINKPFTVVNGQTIRSSIPAFTHNHQYSNEENQYYSHQSYHNQTSKRKFDSSTTSSYHHHQTKRFHSEQILPIYPTQSLSSESFYFDYSQPSTQQQQQQRTSRYMLLKNDPSLSDTLPTVHMPTNFNEPIQMIEHENIYTDDIEHLLDIFKNEVEMIGLDPIATTSTGDCTIDMNHCLSSNEFCSY
ncbi:unnamed protein product [Adineta steineri]|uniref:Uncharacterized protein n=1 Tax=Adineta steineri TaxID=433720 RepID=A0A818QD18_9BILA|nr:unnamed protein product [Adineta steineri]CAF1145943.1 unnamed protein product [Adineta steineri]CAF3635355.1 unnamed protein product [Adineta steineri]CAF3730778.1 unnamed protein product [Adineta steineri]